MTEIGTDLGMEGIAEDGRAGWTSRDSHSQKKLCLVRSKADSLPLETSWACSELPALLAAQETLSEIHW